MTETDDFTRMIDTSNRFFAELSDNNSRDWFEPRKALYTDEIKAPALRFADLMAQELVDLTSVRYDAKLFRIYRDVRFSKDKTPYNAHLHMIWSASGTEEKAPMWFFGSDPKGIVFMMGYPSLKGERLTQYREMVDQHGSEIILASESAGAALTNWGAAPLKRVPAPYGADHPQCDLLRRKGMVFQVNLDESWRNDPAGLPGACRTIATKLLPVYTLLKNAMV